MYYANAFTTDSTGGNPAAVEIVEHYPPADEMQRIAAREGLSETAFIRRISGNDFELRWFTPKTEVRLCGHATLAGAFILWQQELVERSQAIAFHTLSGTLMARWREDWIVLNFPQRHGHAVAPHDELYPALGFSPIEVLASEDLLVEAPSAQAVRDLRPDFDRLARIETRGIIVTAASDNRDFDYVCRFFAPRVGIDEDPVTGSAHCMLAPFWGGRLDRRELTGWQASPRGGVIKVKLAPDDRVLLMGQAVIADR
jgi:PhzF family phenazine biosynthesis protein